MRSTFSRIAAALLLGLFMAGCVEQTLTIRTDPPGALVYLNGEEIGRSPVTRDFLWYGDYDIRLRKEGYETLNTHKWVVAKWWGWMPLDLFANLAPVTFRDNRELTFQLQPTTAETSDPQAIIARGRELQTQLESSPLTRQPATRRATSAPVTRPTTTTP